MKVANVAPGYPGTSQFRHDLGYGEQETGQIIRAIRYAQTQSAMAATVSQAQPARVFDTTVVETCLGITGSWLDAKVISLFSGNGPARSTKPSSLVSRNAPL